MHRKPLTIDREIDNRYLETVDLLTRLPLDRGKGGVSPCCLC